MEIILSMEMDRPETYEFIELLMERAPPLLCSMDSKFEKQERLNQEFISLIHTWFNIKFYKCVYKESTHELLELIENGKICTKCKQNQSIDRFIKKLKTKHKEMKTCSNCRN